MRMVEVQVPAREVMERMNEMRMWFDDHRFEPSEFTYEGVGDQVEMRVSFKVDDEAEAFAQRFSGSLLSY